LLKRMLYTTILLGLFFAQLCAQQKVIFDADMNGDVDDVGALAALHALADDGEAEILACITSHPGAYVCQCMDAINTWYHRPNLPIAAIKGGGSAGQYTRQIAENFPNDVSQAETPEPVDLYRQILAVQPDSSVTIITVGFLPNIAALLKSGADAFSELDGMALVEKKVKEWVCMGGVFPEGSEYNLTNMFADDAVYAVTHWPGRLIFTGWEIGKEIMTGQYVQQHLINSPVKKAYQLFYCSWAFDGNPYYAYSNGHYSWDQTAVWIAVRGISPYWDVVDQGYCYMNEDGTNEWRTDANKNHQYVIPKLPEAEIEKEIDALMNQSPVGAFFILNAVAGWVPFTVKVDASISNPGFGNTVQTYQWDFGDGTTVMGEQATHVYQTPGFYEIELTLTNDKNNTLVNRDSVLVSEPIFADDPYFGNAINYERVNDNLWSTRVHQNDLRYFLSHNERRPTHEFDGYSFIEDSLYSTFSFQADICIGEDLQANRTANYKLLFGFQDSLTYNVIQMRHGLSRIYAFQNGNREHTAKLTEYGLPDEAYHSVRLTNDGQTFSVYLDGKEIFAEANENLVRTGKLAFGSDKDAVYFDNIFVHRQVTEVTPEIYQPARLALSQNYPNPFNSQTTICYSLPYPSEITLEIYAINGRKIRTLDQRFQSKGTHQVIWDGADAAGQSVSSGIYWAKFTAKGFSRVIKMSLLK